MDYEDAARRLLRCSQVFAKGPMRTVRELSEGTAPVARLLADCSDRELAPSEIAERVGCSRSRITRILDELAGKGYIERRTDPSDRRRVLVRMTASGRAHVREDGEEGVRAVMRSLEDLGGDGTRELVRVLERACTIAYGEDFLEQASPGAVDGGGPAEPAARRASRDAAGERPAPSRADAPRPAAPGAVAPPSVPHAV